MPLHYPLHGVTATLALLFCELLGFLGLVILIEGLVHITFNFSRPFSCLSFPCSRLGTYWKAHWCPLVKEEDQANREACLAAEGSLSETICPTLLFRAHTLLSHWRACLAGALWVELCLELWTPGYRRFLLPYLVSGVSLWHPACWSSVFRGEKFPGWSAVDRVNPSIKESLRGRLQAGEMGVRLVFLSTLTNPSTSCCCHFLSKAW